MTVIKINAITVPADSGGELARRFAARAGAVDGRPGFEGFELLRPTDERNVWLVVTRWADEESFQDWVRSSSFAAGHGGRSGGESGRVSKSPTHPEPDTRTPETPGAGAPDSRRPVGMAAELWSYEVAGGSAVEFAIED